MTLSQQQKLTFGALILYWPVLFIVAHIPIPQLVRRAHVSDKSLHFVAYLILVFLLWFAINPQSKVNWRRAAVWWVLLVIAGYGIADELLQNFVSGRSCDVRDFTSRFSGDNYRAGFVFAFKLLAGVACNSGDYHLYFNKCCTSESGGIGTGSKRNV